MIDDGNTEKMFDIDFFSSPCFNCLKTRNLTSSQVQNHTSKAEAWDRIVMSFQEWEVCVYSLARLCMIF